jgi:photosystem II stability/assembly factor-like uncharacterized protein
MKTYIRTVVIILCFVSSIMGQWTKQNSTFPKGVSTMWISSVNENVAWVAGYKKPFPTSYTGYMKTIDGGNNWNYNTISSENGTITGLCAIDENNAWVCAWDKSERISGRVYKTVDGGSTWTRQTTAYPDSGSAPGFIHFFDANNGVTVGDPKGGYLEVYTTSDGGENWMRVPKSNIPAATAEFASVSVYTVSDDMIWHIMYNSGRIFYSSDKGVHWKASYPQLPDATKTCQCAFQNETIGIVVNYPSTIKKTTDGGASWFKITAPSGINMNWISYVPGTVNTYVITCDEANPGSAYTNDGGNTWTTIDSVEHSVSAFISPTIGWSGAYKTNEISKWDGSLTAVEKIDSKIPENFNLSQNYPNPFNPSTKIKFDIPKQSNVKFAVYDVLGREVDVIVNKEMLPGSYEVTFNAQNLSTGVYFYKIECGDQIKSAKMLLVK